MFIPLLLGFVFLTIGVTVLVFALRQRNRVAASKAWPSTQGRVISTQVATKQRDISDSNSNTPVWRTDYIPEVTYEYAVGNASFRSHQIAFGSRVYGNGPAAQQVLQKYPVHGVVTVYYDPMQPGTAVLEQNAAGGAMIMLVTGGCFTLIGAVALLLGTVAAFYAVNVSK